MLHAEFSVLNSELGNATYNYSMIPGHIFDSIIKSATHTHTHAHAHAHTHTHTHVHTHMHTHTQTNTHTHTHTQASSMAHNGQTESAKSNERISIGCSITAIVFGVLGIVAIVGGYVAYYVIVVSGSLTRSFG